MESAMSDSLKKPEMVKMIAAECLMSQVDAARVYDSLFDAKEGIIAKTLVEGRSVAFQGLGSFDVVSRSGGERKAFGGTITVAPSRAVKFKAGRTVTNLLND